MRLPGSKTWWMRGVVRKPFAGDLAVVGREVVGDDHDAAREVGVLQQLEELLGVDAVRLRSW